MNRKNWLALMTVVPFFGLLIAMAIWSVAAEDQTMSTPENRTLQQRPANDVYQFASLPTQWTDYVVDQFPQRDWFLATYTAMELAQGKQLVRSAYVVEKEWLLIGSYAVDATVVEGIFTALGQLDIPVVMGVLPQKNEALDEVLQPVLAQENIYGNSELWQRGAVAQTNVTLVDVPTYFAQSFGLEQRMELYFHTDFHWNALGAYEAISYVHRQMLAEQLVTATVDDVDGQLVWTDLTGEKLWQGDLNVRFSNYFSMEEYIPYYTLDDGSDTAYFLSLDDGQPVERSQIVAEGLELDTISYNDLFTKNWGYYRVEHPSALEQQSVLVLKDSYQNGTIDYLTALFSTVQVVDPRYVAEDLTMEQLMEGVDLVLYLDYQDNASQELVDFLKK